MNNEFVRSNYYISMRQDIEQQYRKIGHALDNYGTEMSNELRSCIEELYKVVEKVEKQMREDYVKSNR